MKYAVVLILLFSACQTGTKKPAVIRDFRRDLQPTLQQIIAKGYIWRGDGDTLAGLATAEELRRMEHGEHPLLRAVACLALLQRQDVDHFDLIMHHLDDTATIPEDRGEEWQLPVLTMVSNLLLRYGRWKNEASRQITRDSVYLHHAYLEEAFSAADIVGTRPEYYAVIKKMALEEGRYGFNGRQPALYGLARFKKKEDIPLIRNVLLHYRYRFDWHSFRVMKDFPDTAYMVVFQGCYPRRFYEWICNSQDSGPAEAFIDALAVYKSDSSASILGAIFDHRPFQPCWGDTTNVMYKLLDAVWDNSCPAYNQLRKRMMAARKEMDTAVLRVNIDSSLLPHYHDTTSEPVRWW